jgi:hypothetical protein
VAPAIPISGFRSTAGPMLGLRQWGQRHQWLVTPEGFSMFDNSSMAFRIRIHVRIPDKSALASPHFSHLTSASGLRISESCFETATCRETEEFPDAGRV